MATWKPMESGIVFRPMEDDGTGRPKVGDAINQLGVRTGLAGKGSDFKRPGSKPSPNGEGLSVVPHKVENMAKLRLPPVIVPRKVAEWGLGILPVYKLDVSRLPPTLQTAVSLRLVNRNEPEGETVEKGIIQARAEMTMQCFQDALAATKSEWEEVVL